MSAPWLESNLLLLPIKDPFIENGDLIEAKHRQSRCHKDNGARSSESLQASTPLHFFLHLKHSFENQNHFFILPAHLLILSTELFPSKITKMSYIFLKINIIPIH